MTSQAHLLLLLGAVLAGLLILWRLLPARHRWERGRFFDGGHPLPPEGSKVWLRGAAEVGEPLKGPLTGRPCVYWRVSIELWQGGPWGKVQRFVLRRARDFAVKADTGRVGIAVDGLELEAPDDALRTRPIVAPSEPVTPGSVLEDLIAGEGYSWDPQGLSSVLAREAIIGVGTRVEVRRKVRHEVASDGAAGTGAAYREAPMRVTIVQPGTVRSLERAPDDLVAEVIEDNAREERATT